MMRHTVSCLIMLFSLSAISFSDGNDEFTFPLQIGNKWFLHGSEPGVYDHVISYQVVDTVWIAGTKYYDIEPGLFAVDGLYRVDSLLNFIEYSDSTEVILCNFLMQENESIIMHINEEIPDTAICSCLYRHLRPSPLGTDNIELGFGLNWSLVTPDIYMYLNVMDSVGLSGIGKAWYDRPYVLFGAKIGGQFYGDSIATNIFDKRCCLHRFFLTQNYPNPFNPTTTISFDLPKDGFVNLKIYDITGRLVRLLMQEQKFAGEHSIPWDGLDDAGQKVAAGVYLYRIEFVDVTGERSVETRKMGLVK